MTLVAAAGGWRHYELNTFSLSLPSSWQPLPSKRAAVPALAKRLRAEGKADLAGQYMAAYKDDYQWSREIAFQAFEWPAQLAITTDIVVKVGALPSGGATGKTALKALVTSLVSEIARTLTKGDRVTAPVYIRLPAGDSYRAELVAALDPSYGAAKSYTIIYWMIAKHRFYAFAFRGEYGAGGLYRPTAMKIVRTIHFK
jgi:hypothetical protein